MCVAQGSRFTLALSVDPLGKPDGVIVAHLKGVAVAHPEAAPPMLHPHEKENHVADRLAIDVRKQLGGWNL